MTKAFFDPRKVETLIFIVSVAAFKAFMPSLDVKHFNSFSMRREKSV